MPGARGVGVLVIFEFRTERTESQFAQISAWRHQWRWAGAAVQPARVSANCNYRAENSVAVSPEPQITQQVLEKR